MSGNHFINIHFSNMTFSSYDISYNNTSELLDLCSQMVYCLDLYWNPVFLYISLSTQINTHVQYIQTHTNYRATWTTKLQVQTCHLSARGFSTQTAPVTTLPLTSVQNAQTVDPAMQKIDTEFAKGFFNPIFYHNNMMRSLLLALCWYKYFSSTWVSG